MPPYQTLFGEHFTVCEICGAYVSKRRKHKRWHRRLDDALARRGGGDGDR